MCKEPFRSSLENFAANSTFNLCKSIPVPMDLCICELSDKSIIHSFLAFEWAIVADVDLESEKYRFLGALRFVVGALKRIISKFIVLSMLGYCLSKT